MLMTKDIRKVFQALGLSENNPGASDGRTWFGNSRKLEVVSPINGEIIAEVSQADDADYQQVIQQAQEAFRIWREVPAPVRGEIVRQLGQALRANKENLGRLVTMEMGKSIQEGWGEVQEMIDICDYACGLSRQLYGVQTHSERARHRIYEQWHPLGLVGVITAFNFPVAVWAWNLAIALVCGDVVIWKPASLTPLTAIACQKILEKVLRENDLPPGIACLIIGRGAKVGELMNRDPRVNLVSYTGSCRMGKHIASTVGTRLGKTILELGGNNAVIVTPNADLDLAAENIFFGAVGTAGQRCTTTRRVIVEESVYETFQEKLFAFYARLTVGNPLDEQNQMGPLVSEAAVQTMFEALATIDKQGGKLLTGGRKLTGEDYPGGCYVTPAVVEVPADLLIIREETFAPILYLIRYSGTVKDAVAIQNDVPQGLSSAIFTENLVEAESFLSAVGSDCGIANVNLGTSGAEIGLAFGGEKETGGGRESGSDAWKAYMRRQTNTINWSRGTALAQGIKFE